MNIKIEDQIKWAKESLAMLETSTTKQVREMRIKQSEAQEQLEKQKAVIKTLQGISHKMGSQVVMFKDDNV